MKTLQNSDKLANNVGANVVLVIKLRQACTIQSHVGDSG